MQIKIENWLRIALFNLCIVALLGVTLRYKIAFSLPFIDQRNLLHGHSHFAFSGWITQALMILMVHYLYKNAQEKLSKRYTWLLVANLITSYGMLISFPIQGYGLFSILFSIFSIFVSYIFAIIYWKDLNKFKTARSLHLWFKAALIFNVISSLGPFYLTYMMANHITTQKAYLASTFYFLHFQYNGWFLFACIGLFFSKLYELIGEEKSLKYIFGVFALSCFPTYLLSILWLPIPKYIYVLIVLSAITQLTAWIWVLKLICNYWLVLKKEISNIAKCLLVLAAIAMSIKLGLQLGSTYPPISQLAFGFHPIVIGYLHLVFLCIITVFILAYLMSEKLITMSKMTYLGTIAFVSGVFINEVLLMIQGVYAIANNSIPHINAFLFIAAIIMFIGVFLINISVSLQSKVD